MRGKIVRWIKERGFGFIKGEDKQTYFFHVKDVHFDDSGRVIEQGEIMEFDSIMQQKGLVSVNVRRAKR